MTSTEMLYRIRRFAAEDYGVPLEGVAIVEDVPGYGIHEHGVDCASRCMRQLDNSDSIVTVRYNDRGHLATYGVLGDRFTLWMD